jgi:hypothetical protein
MIIRLMSKHLLMTLELRKMLAQQTEKVGAVLAEKG